MHGVASPCRANRTLVCGQKRVGDGECCPVGCAAASHSTDEAVVRGYIGIALALLRHFEEALGTRQRITTGSLECAETVCNALNAIQDPNPRFQLLAQRIATAIALLHRRKTLEDRDAEERGVVYGEVVRQSKPPRGLVVALPWWKRTYGSMLFVFTLFLPCCRNSHIPDSIQPVGPRFCGATPPLCTHLVPTVLRGRRFLRGPLNPPNKPKKGLWTHWGTPRAALAFPCKLCSVGGGSSDALPGLHLPKLCLCMK